MSVALAQICSPSRILVAARAWLSYMARTSKAAGVPHGVRRGTASTDSAIARIEQVGTENGKTDSPLGDSNRVKLQVSRAGKEGESE